MRILLAEDDASIAHALSASLVDCGYVVDHVDNGISAKQALMDVDYDLLVLDLGLPRMDGIKVLREMRACRNTAPVMVVTARDELEQRVDALDIGADDYLVKPFALREFTARARALLRRRGNDGIPDLLVGRLRANLAACRAWIDEVPIELTAREYALLEALLVRRNRVVGRHMLMTALCDWEHDISDNGLDILMHRLRRKLEGSGVRVRTLRGLGYLLEEGVESP